MRRVIIGSFALGLALASPAAADFDPLAYLERNGCVQAASEVGASWDEGYPVGLVEEYVQSLINAGQAVEQGAFVVLDPSVCRVRLPEIETGWSLDDPQIAAMITPVDDRPNEPGCFLLGSSDFFSRVYPDPVEAHNEYMAFLAAHVLSGELRFFSKNPLVTPRSWQVMSGECGEVAEAEAIRASYTYISDADFAEYVAYLRETDSCFDETMGSMGEASRSVQGIDPQTGAAPEGAPINVFLDIEYMVITMAAGWRIGASMSERGLSRPPLCRWP